MKKFVFIFIALSISLGAYCSTSFVSLDSIRTYEISEEPSSLTVRLTTDSTIWGAQMILSVPKNMSVTTSDIRLESTRVPQNKGYQLRSKMLSDTTVLIVISPSVAVTHFTTDTLDLFHVGYDWSELPILGHRYPITISDILMISNEGLSSYIQEPIYTFFEYAEKPKYEITFLGYDGTVLLSDSVPLWELPSYTGATPIKPATAQYTFTFAGWSPSISPATSDAVYTAQFDSVVNKYTITFVDEDGTTTLQTSEVEYGQVPAYNGTTPTKAATAQYTYAFAGWSPEVVAVTCAATYTATYSSTINSYLITFVNYDGATLQSGNVNYGVTPAYNGTTPTKPATAQYTYTFVGWDKEIVSVVGAETYTAQFDSVVNKYTIIFVDEDGTMLQTSEVEYGQIPTYNGTTPSKQATAQYTYAFAGWSPEVVAVTAAATYTATYSSTINSYLITFVNYDGMTLQSGNVNYGVTPTYTGTTPTKPATAQYTYTFKGWDKTIVSVVGIETYTAQFDSIVNKYTISFVDEDGTTLQTSEVEYGQVPAYNGTTPTKSATAQYTYAFAGWSPEVVAVTAAATYTATYSSTLNSYMITFVNYDGTTLQSGVVNYGVTPAYTGATPTKPATAQYTYTFKGWDKAIVSVVGAETYTAQFDSIVNKYTITVIGENCTFLGDGTYDYGTEVTLVVTPDEGYWFVQWSDGVVEATRQIIVTEDATFIALIEKQSIGTGWQENTQSEQVQKIYDGTHYYILRGGKRYTMQGQEVR